MTERIIEGNKTGERSATFSNVFSPEIENYLVRVPWFLDADPLLLYVSEMGTP